MPYFNNYNFSKIRRLAALVCLENRVLIEQARQLVCACPLGLTSQSGQAGKIQRVFEEYQDS
ncbi:MAG: hypothetical protein ABII72_03225 [Parcubacteria group bacterium]